MKNGETAHVQMWGADDNSLMLSEKRFEIREQIAVPVKLANGAMGTTRNISTAGLFFETASEYQVGSQIELTIDLSTVGRPFFLKAIGEVLRTQDLGERTGVAVKLQKSRLHAET